MNVEFSILRMQKTRLLKRSARPEKLIVRHFASRRWERGSEPIGFQNWLMQRAARHDVY